MDIEIQNVAHLILYWGQISYWLLQ